MYGLQYITRKVSSGFVRTVTKSRHVNLVSASGPVLKISGSAVIVLNLGKLHVYGRFTIVHDFRDKIILGAPFLAHNKALIDFKNNTICIQGNFFVLKDKTHTKPNVLLRVARPYDVPSASKVKKMHATFESCTQLYKVACNFVF